MRALIVWWIVCAASASTQAGLSRLEALGMIETGNNDSAVGDAGEVSRYQIKPWIWRRYSHSDVYQNHQLSSEVAEKYLATLEQVFRDRTGREPADFDVYVLWNAGPTYYSRIGFKQARVHPVIRERARRYVNLRQRVDEPVTKVRPTVVAKAGKSFLEPPAANPTSVVSPSLCLAASSSPTPALPSEPFWPVVLIPQAVGVPSPLFSTLPLTARPEPASINPPPLFAVGGVQPQ